MILDKELFEGEGKRDGLGSHSPRIPFLSRSSSSWIARLIYKTGFSPNRIQQPKTAPLYSLCSEPLLYYMINSMPSQASAYGLGPGSIGGSRGESRTNELACACDMESDLWSSRSWSRLPKLGTPMSVLRP